MPLSGRVGAGERVGAGWLDLALPRANGAYDEQGRLLKIGCVRVTPVDETWAAPVSAKNSIPQPARFPLKQGNFPGEALVHRGEADPADRSQPNRCALDVAFATWRDRATRRHTAATCPTATSILTPDEITAGAKMVSRGFIATRHSPWMWSARDKVRASPPRRCTMSTSRRTSGGAIAVLGAACPQPVAVGSTLAESGTARPGRRYHLKRST